MHAARLWTAALVACVVAAGCTPATAPDGAAAGAAPPVSPAAPATAAAPASPAAPASSATPASPAPVAGRFERPAWLGRRKLPLRPDGYGEIRPTPPRLRDRRLATVDVLPSPASAEFTAEVRRVPRAVLERSTWSRRCPVARRDLRYVTVTFHGFDGRPHSGELLVNAAVADDLVEVFRTLYREQFPIEEMRVVSRSELDLHPTGDGNNTTAFVCRPSRSSTAWSEHAFGRAVDINPFHNPYVRGDVVLPELASAYRDRDRRRPGMVLPDGPVVAAFERIGWEWGGHWRSLKDWMHFSATGR